MMIMCLPRILRIRIFPRRLERQTHKTRCFRLHPVRRAISLSSDYWLSSLDHDNTSILQATTLTWLKECMDIIHPTIIQTLDTNFLISEVPLYTWVVEGKVHRIREHVVLRTARQIRWMLSEMPPRKAPLHGRTHHFVFSIDWACSSSDFASTKSNQFFSYLFFNFF